MSSHRRECCLERFLLFDAVSFFWFLFKTTSICKIEGMKRLKRFDCPKYHWNRDGSRVLLICVAQKVFVTFLPQFPWGEGLKTQAAVTLPPRKEEHFHFVSSRSEDVGSDTLQQSRDVNWFSHILSECSSHPSTRKGWGYSSSWPVNWGFCF